ncbi:hypothetical protein A9Z42_0015640 [Trichoderma parareesei]|uniref:DNA2/NAM7 helicase helicase domain-containing protein n=1 Tax=Trichoderma parareesei TaxID=858221 RepID=A0A2H2ZG71_TRIPA|nr:hypothetical protein A9Z42_0015640 [Trichoderma parareesei]
MGALKLSLAFRRETFRIPLQTYIHASDGSDAGHEEFQHPLLQLDTAALRDRDAGVAWVPVDEQAIEATAQTGRCHDRIVSSAFIFADEELLLGYHISHARRLGESCAPGLRTDTIQRWGPNIEPSLTIHFRISVDGVLRTFAVCEIAMARLSRVPSAETRTVDDSFIASHFRDLITSTQLGFGRRDESYLNTFEDISPATSLAEYMRVISDKIVRININLNEAGSPILTTYYPTKFWEQQLQCLHSDARGIADTVRNVLSGIQHGEYSSLWVVFPDDKQSWLSKWGPLLSRDSCRSPYHHIARDECQGNIDDLSYRDINLVAVDRKNTLDRAVTFFLTKDERTVTLIGGAADEANWLKQQADACGRDVFNGWALPIPGSEWDAQETDELVYGIKGTGAPTKFIVAIPLKDGYKRCLLPEAGTAVRLYINLPQRFNQSPDKSLIASQVESFATALASGLSEAHSEAVKSFNVAQDRSQEMLHERYDDIEIDAQEELVDTILDDKYLEVATPKILSYIATFFRDAHYSMPDADIDAKRRLDARQAAELLRKSEHEDELDHRKRILGWMASQIAAARKPLNGKHGQPCTGIRVNIPSYRSGDAYFQVDAPLQPTWPQCFRQPPMQFVDLPLSTMPWKFGTYMDNLAQHQADARQIKIEYDINETMAEFECDTINILNNVAEDPTASNWWSFLLSFDPIFTPPAHDLVERFTGLGQFIAQGKFVKHNEAIEAFRHARASKVFIAGGSSSGRSRFAATVVHAIKSGQDMAVTARSPSVVLWTAPHHVDVDDGFKRLREMMPHKRILRMYSYHLELRAFLKATLDTPPQVPIPERTSSTIERLENNPTQYPIMNEAWGLEESDPVTYRGNKRAYLEDARRLLSTFITQADIIVATPTDVRLLYDHVPDLSPCFLVVNEAGKMTESMSLMPLSRHPHLPTLFIGDTRDAGPQAVAKKDSGYRALFAEQRETSLLQRVEAAGQLDFVFAGDATKRRWERGFEAWKNDTPRLFTREIKLMEDDILPDFMA